MAMLLSTIPKLLSILIGIPARYFVLGRSLTEMTDRQRVVARGLHILRVVRSAPGRPYRIVVGCLYLFLALLSGIVVASYTPLGADLIRAVGASLVVSMTAGWCTGRLGTFLTSRMSQLNKPYSLAALCLAASIGYISGWIINVGLVQLHLLTSRIVIPWIAATSSYLWGLAMWHMINIGLEFDEVSTKLS